MQKAGMNIQMKTMDQIRKNYSLALKKKQEQVIQAKEAEKSDFYQVMNYWAIKNKKQECNETKNFDCERFVQLTE